MTTHHTTAFVSSFPASVPAAPPASVDVLGGNIAEAKSVNSADELSSAAGLPSKAAQLRDLIFRPELGFLMEAHNGLSARIAEEAGFEALWGSGLSISSALGVRDSNEASWTQVLEVLEFMSDATSIPILLDGDTGYGNFNNMRRLVRKLEQRNIAGVCIEDKIFPKTNSFINGSAQPLADIDEFCGKIKAGKDAQADDDFIIVARVEAFIAGWGLEEAIRRAGAYHAAGADAILMHSSKHSPEEILAFQQEWGDRAPVLIVPTKYYSTPTDVFREHGIAAVIWANHLMRSCIAAMQKTARQIHEDESLVNVEDRVAPLLEVFRLQGVTELSEAEARYLPKNASHTRAIVLGAARGVGMDEVTLDRPKCMIPVAGQPILAHIVGTFRSTGVKDITIVRGYKKEAIRLEGVHYCDAAGEPGTSEVQTLAAALPMLNGQCVIAYGDVLFKKYIAQALVEAESDFAIAVDTNWQVSRNKGRYADYVTCSDDSAKRSFYGEVNLVQVSNELPPEEIHGEWMGFFKVSQTGAQILGDLLEELEQDPVTIAGMDMGRLMNELVRRGHEIRVIYTTGNWLDVDSVADVVDGSSFQ